MRDLKKSAAFVVPPGTYVQNLEEFNLAHNQIAHLPVEICQLQSLKVLDLRSNGLMELPEEINQLVELTTLYVQVWKCVCLIFGNLLEDLNRMVLVCAGC